MTGPIVAERFLAGVHMSGDKGLPRSLMSYVVAFGTSARLLAARCLPRPIKAALKTGPMLVAIDALEKLEARVFSRRLIADTVFDPSIEQSAASASMSIIVPIHDAPLVTMRCLTSLERHAPEAEIILVDDGSKIAKTTDVIREFSVRNDWKVVRNEKSGGHSAACAAGARLASRPYLCLLNSDTIVTPRCWRAIQDAFESDPSIGVAGPCTSFSGGNEQTVDIARKSRFYWDDNQICAFAERIQVAAAHPVIFDLPWVAGFALFIRRTLWEKLGGFDQNLRDYANEVELCTRVAASEQRIVWVRSAYIHHMGGRSYGNIMAVPEIKSRNMAALEYIRNKHNPPASHPITD
jgi:GT2 family glycosyltransferase